MLLSGCKIFAIKQATAKAKRCIFTNNIFWCIFANRLGCNPRANTLSTTKRNQFSVENIVEGHLFAVVLHWCFVLLFRPSRSPWDPHAQRRIWDYPDGSDSHPHLHLAWREPPGTDFLVQERRPGLVTTTTFHFSIMKKYHWFLAIKHRQTLRYSDALLAPSDAFFGPLASRKAAWVWQTWAVNLSA